MAEPYDYKCYTVGLCAASVCTRLSDEETTKRLNMEHPVGFGPGWTISKDTHFRQGQTNPCPCEDMPDTHRHILYEC